MNSSTTQRATPGGKRYLLKHAHLRFAELASAALEQYGIDGREFAVLLSLEEGALLSQREAAGRLGIDRTTMVALIDGLESKGIVERSPNRADRRKKVVQLTPAGRSVRRRAIRTIDAVESRFLKPLSNEEARRFREALHLLVFSDEPP